MFKLKAENGSNNITGQRLISIRHKLNISQRQLARMMQLAGYDVDHHFIRRIENGERFVTDIELVVLSKVLKVDIMELIDDTIPVSSQDSN
ncbi:MAG: helix-turn-helix domain-containing protein [Porcipelethomonas sp.]